MDQEQDLPSKIRDPRQRLAAMEARLAAVEQERLNAALPDRPRFYVVVVGRRTGVFTTTEEANEQTLGFRNGRQRMFHTMEEAVAFFNAHVGIPPSSGTGLRGSKGPKPAGVYASPEQTNKQTHGFHNAMQQRCHTMEEAHAYIAEFWDPAPAKFPLFVIDREPDGDDDEQEEDQAMNG
jgi:viroplasmin and RNaseH domain-containing protein